jgi:hypothetical protein
MNRNAKPESTPMMRGPLKRSPLLSIVGIYSASSRPRSTRRAPSAFRMKKHRPRGGTRHFASDSLHQLDLQGLPVPPPWAHGIVPSPPARGPLFSIPATARPRSRAASCTNVSPTTVDVPPSIPGSHLPPGREWPFGAKSFPSATTSPSNHRVAWWPEHGANEAIQGPTLPPHAPG